MSLGLVDLLGISREGQVTDEGSCPYKPAGGDAKAAGFDSQQAALSPLIPSKSIKVSEMVTRQNYCKREKSAADIARKKARRDKWKAKRREQKAHRVCCICSIQGFQLTAGQMVIDHDHRTMMIRGWLCDPCNGRLGTFEHWTPKGISWADSPMLWWIEKYYDRIIRHLNTNTGISYRRRSKFIRRP